MSLLILLIINPYFRTCKPFSFILRIQTSTSTNINKIPYRKGISWELLRKKQNPEIYHPKEKVTRLKILTKMSQKSINHYKEHCSSDMRRKKNLWFCFNYLLHIYSWIIKIYIVISCHKKISILQKNALFAC